MEQQVLGVTELNQIIKSLLDNIPLLNQVFVRGEISNYKLYPSGHHYFTLKDAEGAIRCVMFRGQAGALRFHPENGMKVIAAGRVTVFPRDGAYQLYCSHLSPDGVGDLHVAFEQLKERLWQEGLFDEANKKPLPRYPRRIALITSPAGAAVHDMIRILRRRYPAAEVKVLPVRVQGVEAPPEIAGAIRYANLHQLADLIITGRGGGSIEDLWAFNDERVARAIYASEIPVISAVGHEPDVTIADFAADVRAATPSHAAELAVPDQQELRQRLADAQARILAANAKRLQIARQRLETMASKRVLKDPMAFIQDKRMLLDYMQQRFSHGADTLLYRPKNQLAALAAKLDAMSPLKVLARGFSVVTDEDGTIIRSASQVDRGDTVKVALAEGALRCSVEERIARED